jgi:hypothetical protein
VGDRVELHDGVSAVLLVLVSSDVIVGKIRCAMYTGKNRQCYGVRRGRAVGGCNMRIPYLWVSTIIIIFFFFFLKKLIRSSMVYFLFFLKKDVKSMSF